jgi:aspartyl-tRNA(Asn)/glutamyl-tRNA(Gln) amidotransferase subunit B
MRIEPNISVRPVVGAGLKPAPLGTKVEIKNLNSFRALERGVDFEIKRHIQILESGGKVAQETVGWDESQQATYSQRSKEDAHDYRYFPEPDLPPLKVGSDWLEAVRASMPELPWARNRRFVSQYGLNPTEAWGLVTDQAAGQYFESVLKAGSGGVRAAYAWVTGELSALMNSTGTGYESLKIQPKELANLLKMVADGLINQNSAKAVLAEMFETGQPAAAIVDARGLAQVSDAGFIAEIVSATLAENPKEVESYRAGKLTVSNFLFGQVMRKAGGKANPQVVRQELERQLK